MNRWSLTCLTKGHNWRKWPHPSLRDGWIVIRCSVCGKVQEREGNTAWTADR